MCLCVLQFFFFPVVDFYPHSVVARKMLDTDFCFLKFAKVCFVVQHVENVSYELENNVYSSAFNRIFYKCQ